MFANTGHSTVVWSPSQTWHDFNLAFVSWSPCVQWINSFILNSSSNACNALLLCGTSDWLVHTDCDLTDGLWVEVCPSQRTWFSILALSAINLENSSKLGNSSALTTTSIQFFLTSQAGSFLKMFLFSNSSFKLSKYLSHLLALLIWFKYSTNFWSVLISLSPTLGQLSSYFLKDEAIKNSWSNLSTVLTPCETFCWTQNQATVAPWASPIVYCIKKYIFSAYPMLCLPTWALNKIQIYQMTYHAEAPRRRG